MLLQFLRRHGKVGVGKTEAGADEPPQIRGIMILGTAAQNVVKGGASLCFI